MSKSVTVYMKMVDRNSQELRHHIEVAIFNDKLDHLRTLPCHQLNQYHSFQRYQAQFYVEFNAVDLFKETAREMGLYIDKE